MGTQVPHLPWPPFYSPPCTHIDTGVRLQRSTTLPQPWEEVMIAAPKCELGPVGRILRRNLRDKAD